MLDTAGGIMTNLETALDFARAGAYVFPCQGRGANRKKPYPRMYWRDLSSRDESTIRQWWRQYPEAVPGIDLAKSGWLVIDADRKPSDGLAWLTAHAAQNGDDLDTPPAVDTPSGGRHLYYQNTFDPPHGNGRGRLPPKIECGIDIRGHGGFVIAPGAVFADGGEYILHGSIFDAGPPPEWLVDLLSGPAVSLPISITIAAEPMSDARLDAYGNVALDGLLAELASSPPGTRNEQANVIAFRAGQLVAGGCLDRGSTLSALEQTALSAWGIHPRDKALGPKGTITRALAAGERAPRGPMDEPAPEVEILLGQGETYDPDTGEIAQEDTELPEHLTKVPGLLGEITDFITDTALYPQRGLALGAALTIVGTAAGRHLAGPLRCGTHLYVVGLAPSGAGKNHPLDQISTILAAADMRAHIGPSQFISMPAVINFLCRSPLAVCAMDEFGAFLKRINNKRASGFEGAISGLLRTAWGASFGAMATPEWAQRASETIFSPALSIYGVSTAREFYDSLEGGDVTNGVLNRFLLIETKTRPEERHPLRAADDVPDTIIRGLKAIYNRNPLVTAQLCQSVKAPAYDKLTITTRAEEVRRALVVDIRARGDADATLEPFLARTAENALRLATIATIGMGSMTIDEDAMIWARDFVVWSSTRLAEGAGLYIADSEHQAVTNAVRRAIQEAGGRIRRRDLLRRVGHRYKARDLEDSIKALAEMEEVVIEKVMCDGGRGRPSYFYSVVRDDKK